MQSGWRKVGSKMMSKDTAMKRYGKQTVAKYWGRTNTPGYTPQFAGGAG